MMKLARGESGGCKNCSVTKTFVYLFIMTLIIELSNKYFAFMIDHRRASMNETYSNRQNKGQIRNTLTNFDVKVSWHL